MIGADANTREVDTPARDGDFPGAWVATVRENPLKRLRLQEHTKCDAPERPALERVFRPDEASGQLKGKQTSWHVDVSFAQPIRSEVACMTLPLSAASH